MSEQPRFRGQWLPQLRDPQPWSPHTVQTARAVEALLEEETAPGTPTASPSQDARDAPRGAPAAAGTYEGDHREACARVTRLRGRAEAQGKSLDELAWMLIKAKCRAAALSGIAGASPSMIPGAGHLWTVLFGGAVDVALTTKFQVELVFEMCCLYNLTIASEADRRRVVLLAFGLAGLDALPSSGGEQDDQEDDEAETRKAGERLAARAAEEAAKRSVILSLPLVGVPTAAATNVTGVYVVGRRAQLVARDGAGAAELGTWRSSVKRFVVPEEANRLSALLAEQASHLPSADAVRATASRLALRLGESAKKLVATMSGGST